MASDGSSFIPSIPDSLPDEFHPVRAEGGILGAMKTLFTSGIGTFIAALFVGLASIPAGFILGFQTLIGGLTAFTVEFIESFLLPFELGSRCFVTAGRDCATTAFAVPDGGWLVQSAGVLGLVASTLLVGASIYAVATVVGSYVS